MANIGSAVRFDRVAIIGDVGGHRRVFRHTLGNLGIDVDRGVMPVGLCVIQVGDLIGGRADDAGVVEDVDGLIHENAGRWIQLAGNWEARHLGGPVLDKRGCEQVPLPTDAEARLQEWWRSGSMTVAAAVRSRQGGVAFVTHAGLTREYWLRELHGEHDATSCADRLNDLARSRPGSVFRPGMMLAGASYAGSPGPLWAIAGTELWASWAGKPMPFHQVHGHTSAYYFGGRRWNDHAPEPLRRSADVFRRTRHVSWRNGGHKIVGIDPGLGRHPSRTDLVPLVLSSPVVLLSPR